MPNKMIDDVLLAKSYINAGVFDIFSCAQPGRGQIAFLLGYISSFSLFLSDFSNIWTVS